MAFRTATRDFGCCSSGSGGPMEPFGAQLVVIRTYWATTALSVGGPARRAHSAGSPLARSRCDSLRLKEPECKGLFVRQTGGSMPGGSQVYELLWTYQEVLDAVGELPLMPMVLWRRTGRLHYLPRPRWLLRYFMLRHVVRVLSGLDRRYSARAALGLAADTEQQDREAVREFRQSLPPIRQNIYLILLVVATVVLGRPIIDKVITVAFDWTQASRLGDSELHRQTRQIVEALGESVSVDFTSANRAIDALLSGGLIPVALVTLGLVLSLYVVLRPFVPSFRLKRMLLNLAPESEGQHRSVTAGWSVSHATGIYERERLVFEELGGRPPVESPFDLIVPALVMLLPMAWGGLALGLGVADPRGQWRVFFFASTAFMLIPALSRLGWLYQAWRRRRSGRPDPRMPFEVGIRRGSAIARVERPVGVRLLLFFWLLLFYLATGATEYGDNFQITLLEDLKTALLAALVLSIPASLLCWYRMDREVRDLTQARRFGNRSDLFRLTIAIGGPVLLSAIIPPLRDIIPGIVSGLIVLLAFLQTAKYIRRAQARAGQRESLRFSWLLAPGLLLHPFLFAYLQHELNKIWAVEGKPLDPSPTKASDATVTLPPLRVPRAKH